MGALENLKKIWLIRKPYSWIHSRYVHMFGIRKKKFYYERLKVCKTCPFNSDNVNKKWYQKIWYKLMGNKAYCTICLCPLHLKATEEFEECDKGKWKHIKTF